MKTPAKILALAPLFLFLWACNAPFLETAKEPIRTAPSLDKSQWHLIFQDEFDDSKLNARWDTEYWWGRLNPPELQYYSSDAFDMQNGLLRIRAELRLNLQKPELIRGGYFAGKVPSRLRAQDQQAGIAKPVAEQQHRTRGYGNGYDEFNHLSWRSTGAILHSLLVGATGRISLDLPAINTIGPY